MANHCSYGMKIKGSKENVDEMVNILQIEHYEDGTHLHRVFDATVMQTEDLENNQVAVTIDGYCAWSVYSCMFDGDHTYHRRTDSPNSTTVPKASERLKLDIEIFSEEPGVGFSEHYYVSNGVILIDDVLEDYAEHGTDDYESLEAFNEETGLNITQEQYDSEDYIITGGHGDWMYDNIQ